MTDRLKNKVILITGAAKGIGRACAELFVKEGADVILTDILYEEGKKVAANLGKKASFYPLDVSSSDQWQQVIEQILKTHKKLDGLINNAGITGFDEGFGPQDPENCSLEDWKRVHSINADSVFLGCKYALQAMKKGKNCAIVNLSSRSGIVGIPGATPYASSKASIRNHTKSVALYAAEKGYSIRCNSIHPGAILTPLWDAMLGEGSGKKKAVDAIAQGVPIGRMGTAEEVALMALYLVSDESLYVTGSEFTIDGGILAGASSPPKKR